MDLNELKNVVQAGGVAGAGGAGFPTYAKLDTRIETILLNCAECEPLLKVHRQVLARHAYEIVRTLDQMAEAVGAKEVIIAVKKSYVQAVAAVKSALDGRINHAKIRIGYLPEVYPAGDEVITIYEMTGAVVPPGGIPLDIHVAVFNVETVYNISKMLTYGRTVTDKYLTVAGAVANPMTLRVPIGITVEEVVACAGGSLIKDAVYISGGPMTGRIAEGTEVITKTSNAILVLPPEHYVVQNKKKNTAVDMKRAMASCCQCQMCTDLCPRNLLGHPIAPHAFMRAATTGVTKDLAPFLDTFFCSQCGLCELYACTQGLSPRTLIGEYKNGLRQNGVPIPKGLVPEPVNDVRNYRKVPMNRLTARLNLSEYNKDAPLQEDLVETGLVKIPFSQHIGAPAEAIVKIGEQVVAGQVVAKASEGKLSIPCHASIDGTVVEVNQKYVIVKRS